MKWEQSNYVHREKGRLDVKNTYAKVSIDSFENICQSPIPLLYSLGSSSMQDPSASHFEIILTNGRLFDECCCWSHLLSRLERRRNVIRRPKNLWRVDAVWHLKCNDQMVQSKKLKLLKTSNTFFDVFRHAIETDFFNRCSLVWGKKFFQKVKAKLQEDHL